ncbi:transglycosylase domain-containing protein [Actinoplanes sp. NPDC049599]|uniref:transglycosylase domain-containing protein n=1 Tax=Actinoplanes sp. NPDC049599 TaxID=3363903 RepID=UPI00378D7BFB
MGAPPEAGPAYGGRGAVARAAVRPVPPGVGGPGGPDDRDGVGQGSRGSASKILNKASKRRRRMNILTAAAAVVVILLGAGVVGGTYFFDNVTFKEPTAEAQTTQLLASDNKTVLASLGQFNRSIVPNASINPLIKLAVVSAEDKGFYKHNGIDMKGIARAAWNNFTGGDTQGASTITQQYAKYATKRKEITYNVKLREAVIARKMEDEYSKDEILGRYLNSVYFGRGAYGVEAAVKAYFGPGRSSLTPVGTKGAITAGEAAIIASVIKQPEPSKTHQGYDPQNNMPDAQDRWRYTVGNMAELALPAGMKDAGVPSGINPPTEYPKTWKKWDPDKCTTTCGNNKPSAKIVKYVKRELRDMNIGDDMLNQGGLQIRTTINTAVQEEAEKAANRTSKKSPLADLPDTYKSALVAINPENGRVLAYYGGPDAASWDYAGPNYTDDGKTFIGGGRPPGSTFKIYTLIAALADGYGMDTIWDSTLKKVDGGGKISNAGREGGGLKCPSPKACSLEVSTEQSYNFTFYWLADALGPEKVIQMAHKAGIQLIGDPETAARYDLNKLSESEIEKKGYGREVGFGQYAITALDHANGVATIANNGVYNKAHFVREVDQRDPKTGKFVPVKNTAEKLKPVEAFSPDVAAAVQNVMQKIPGINGINLDNGRKAIGKTGTWEFTGKGGKDGDNGDAWMVGGTKELAAAVWVGREKVNKKKQTELMPIYRPGTKTPMNGGSTPGKIWKTFLDAASKAIKADNKDFLPNTTAFVDPNKKGNGVLPPPPPVEQPDNNNNPLCGFLPCGDNNGNNGGNGNGNNGGETGQPGTTLPTIPGGDTGNDTDGGGGQTDGNIDGGG